MIDRLGGTVDISEAAIGGGSGDIQYLVTRSSFIYVPLPSLCSDLGDFSSNRDFSRI